MASKSIKLAVFGHYDSRGGTTAIQIPDTPTEADITAAIDRYDREVFMLDPVSGDIGATVYGMEARTCDRLVHKLIYGEGSVGMEDFLFVAELHNPPDNLDHDLESTGAVLISDDGSNDDQRNLRRPGTTEWYAKVEAINRTKPDFRTHHQTYKDLESERPADYSTSELVDLTLTSPVQLEYVELPDGWQESKYEDISSIEAEAEAAGVGASFDSRWTEEQKALRKTFQERIDNAETSAERWVEQQATHIANPKFQRWDDDAFGFIVMPMANHAQETSDADRAEA